MVTASTAALVRALATSPPGHRRWWGAYGLLASLGLYTHLLFALMLPLHGT